eukprot:m.438020 g.438020  ORF g.438020 m.438020 type:complete len:145 (+) comp21440_c0_seq17:3778-4212(+)
MGDSTNKHTVQAELAASLPRGSGRNVADMLRSTPYRPPAPAYMPPDPGDVDLAVLQELPADVRCEVEAAMARADTSAPGTTIGASAKTGWKAVVDRKRDATHGGHTNHPGTRATVLAGETAKHPVPARKRTRIDTFFTVPSKSP